MRFLALLAELLAELDCRSGVFREVSFVYEYEGRLDELSEYLEGRLLSYLPDAGYDNPPEGQVAVSHPWFPTIFPENKWPVQATSELYQEGRSRFSDAPTMPAVIAIGWRVHALSLLGKRNNTGALEVKWEGRQEARDRCRKVYANWRDAFLKDEEIEAKSMGLAVGRVEAGDKDRLGTYYEEVTSVGTRVIWLHQAEALIYL